MTNPLRPVLPQAECTELDESEVLDRLRKWGTAPVPVRERSQLSNAPLQIAALGEIILREREQRNRRGARRRMFGWALGLAALGTLALNTGLLTDWLRGGPADAAVSASPGKGGRTPEVPAQEGAPTEAPRHGTRTAMLRGSAHTAHGSTAPTEIPVGSGIEAGPAGAEILAEATHVELAAGAAIDLRELSDGLEAWFVRVGSARFKVDPNRKKRVTVETVDSKFEVVGTEFTVVAPDPTHDKFVTSLLVHHGKVKVSAASGEQALIGANGQWPPFEERAGLGAAAPRGHKSKRAQTRTSAASSSLTTTLAEENRLFQAGVRARNARDDREAMRAFSELLVRYPKTSLRREAEFEMGRARSRLSSPRVP